VWSYFHSFKNYPSLSKKNTKNKTFFGTHDTECSNFPITQTVRVKLTLGLIYSEIFCCLLVINSYWTLTECWDQESCCGYIGCSQTCMFVMWFNIFAITRSALQPPASLLPGHFAVRCAAYCNETCLFES
jgi:hypothetical protein